MGVFKSLTSLLRQCLPFGSYRIARIVVENRSGNAKVSGRKRRLVLSRHSEFAGIKR